jgi:hypothetical protein
MSNDGKFDLSGVFQVQQNYITDLSNSYPNVNNAPLIAKYVLDVQNKVDDVTKSYKKADTSSDNVLTEQNDMINIIKTEQDRIDLKKEHIDQAVMEQKRKALLTESSRLRNAEYTKIILVLVICIVIHILLVVAYKHFFEDPVPSNVFTMFALAHLFNFAIWTITAFYMYVNIQARSQINFNQLNLPPPNTADDQSSTPATADYNNLFKDLGLCYAEGCCGPNTQWVKETGECIAKDSSKSPQQNSSPGEGNVEGFQSNDTLSTLPEFMPGNRTSYDKQYEVKPYVDPLNELKKKTESDVNSALDSVYNSSQIDIPDIDFDDITNNITNSMPENEILGEEQSFGVKCGFTTMDKSSSHPLYAPQYSDANPLLPSLF